MILRIKKLVFIVLVFTSIFGVGRGAVFANGEQVPQQVVEAPFMNDLRTITMQNDVADAPATGMPMTLVEPIPMEPKPLVQKSGYELGAGDKIKITVFGEKDLSGDFKVGGDGKIAMPLIGVVDVNNLDIREAEKHIELKLQDGYLKNPSVTIEVMESRPFYILGEVRRPGSYNYINGMSVLQAIAISGGFTYRANRKKVDILRGNAAPSEPVPVPPEANVKPGDIIFVRERFF